MILVIENDVSLRELSRAILHRGGYATMAAATPAEAFDLMVDYEPALIIINNRLPGCNGADLCHRIRLDPQLREVPIIVTSAHFEDAQPGEADALLPIPYRAHALIELVQTLTGV